MSNNEKIDGGYVLLARAIQDSGIWEKPSDWLKVWIYILQEVRHSDRKLFRRGENFFTFDLMARTCGVSYSSVDHCVRWLKKAGQIATRKTTRGIVIFVVGYAKYQDGKNYKSDTKSGMSGDFKARQKRDRSDTIIEEGKNERTKDIEYMFSEFTRMTDRKIDREIKGRIGKLEKAIEQFGIELLRKAWAQMASDKFLRGGNTSQKDYLTIDYALRTDKIEDHLHNFQTQNASTQ